MTVTAQLDSSVLGTAKPADVSGAIAQGQKEHMVGLEAQQADQDARDNQVLMDYMKVPGVEMYSAKGMEKGLKDLQGRIGPKTFQLLMKGRQAAQKGEADFAQSLTQYKSDQLAQLEEETNYVMQTVAPLVENEKDPEVWRAKRDQALDAAGKEVMPNGQPRVPPQLIEKLKNADKNVFDAIYATTASKKALLDAHLKQANIAKAEALAAESKGRTGNPKLGKQYHSPSVPGIFYQGDKGTFKIDENGERQPVNGLPVDAVPVGAAGSAKNAQANSLIEEIKAKPEVLDQLASEYNVTGKMPSAGQNSPLRPMILMRAAELTIAENKDAAGGRAMYKAESANVSNLTKQYGVIKAGEETVLNNMKLMKEVIGKVDATGVPALERWVRAGRRAIEGDPDVTKLDALIQSTQADIGKVLSASTGAAGVPVEALKKAQKYMGENLTAEQFAALEDIVPKEMTARTDAMEKQIERGMRKIKELGFSVGGKRPASTAPSSAPSGTDNSDRENILRSELNKAREQVRSLKASNGDGAAIRRAEEDVSALERELGGKAKAAPASGAGPTEGQTAKSKSGKPIIFRNGKWEYQ